MNTEVRYLIRDSESYTDVNSYLRSQYAEGIPSHTRMQIPISVLSMLREFARLGARNILREFAACTIVARQAGGARVSLPKMV